MKKQAIYEIPNLDFLRTIENLRKEHRHKVKYGADTQKGLFGFSLRQPILPMQLTPKGKLNVYYSKIEELTPITRELKTLLVTTDGRPPNLTLVRIVQVRKESEEGQGLRVLQDLIEAGFVAEE